jgi:hypothetical protein
MPFHNSRVGYPFFDKQATKTMMVATVAAKVRMAWNRIQGEPAPW